MHCIGLYNFASQAILSCQHVTMFLRETKNIHERKKIKKMLKHCLCSLTTLKSQCAAPLTSAARESGRPRPPLWPPITTPLAIYCSAYRMNDAYQTPAQNGPEGTLPSSYPVTVIFSFYSVYQKRLYDPTPRADPSWWPRSRRRSPQALKGVGFGEGVSPSPTGERSGGCPLPIFFWIFIPKWCISVHSAAVILGKRIHSFIHSFIFCSQ